MIDPVTEWFEIIQCSKKAVTIANLIENTWLVRYPCLVDIMYDQGGELPGYKFKNSLI